MQLTLIDKAGKNTEAERTATPRLTVVASIAAADRPVISKKSLWTGRVISAIPALLLASGGVNALMKSPVVLEGLARLGYPESVLPVIGILELLCITLYVIPRTSILGALLLTAYFGGATASHVRIGDPTFLAPIVAGVLVWAGLWLRNDRLREFIGHKPKAEIEIRKMFEASDFGPDVAEQASRIGGAGPLTRAGRPRPAC